ncbi:MAG: DNA-binding response OmpR family regulator [Candidatus Poriferisodalaceae bacterium]
MLVVEDDLALGQVLQRGLLDEGYAVDLARTYAAADEALFVEDYDLVVLDLGLPEGDGVDLCREM